MVFQLVTFFVLFGLVSQGLAYPVDAAGHTGITRLDAYSLRLEQPVRGVKKPVPGARLNYDEIGLRLFDEGLRLDEIPPRDKGLEKQIRGLLGHHASRYTIALLDLTNLTDPVYAEHRANKSFNPGSVGKLAVLVGLFNQLAQKFPDDLGKREALLRDQWMVGEPFMRAANHNVAFWDAEKLKMKFRRPRPGDEANLWTWLDWTASASSNVAASMLIRESLLMKTLAGDYPGSEQQRREYFKKTPAKQRMSDLRSVLDDGLLVSDIDIEKFRQGGFFTSRARHLAPGGKSYATARELLRFLIAMEQGSLIDEFSSREIKRLLYMTQKRIRYASAPQLNDAALFFKSGSLYRCYERPCPKYKGDKENRLNSVVVVEDPAGDGAGLHYMVVVSSNVLRENSAVAHQVLAGKIHRLMQRRHTSQD